jgi:hypothetical protein
MVAVASRLSVLLRHAEKRSHRTERMLLGVALVLFVVSTWIAFRNLPEVHTEPNWWLLAPAAAVAVMGLAINGCEFAVASHLLGQRIAWVRAFHVSVLSSAANTLPIPGAVVIKTRALRQQGQGYKQSISITAGVGLMWVALAFLFAGILQAWDHELGTAALFLGFAAVGLVATYAFLVAAVGRHRALSASLPVAAVELASVVTMSIRIALILTALGYHAPFGQAVALTAAAIVASAVGIFPGGLGLRELLSAAMAHLVGMDPSVGLIVSAVDRVLVYVVLGVTSSVMLASGATRRALEDIEIADHPNESPARGTQ